MPYSYIHRQGTNKQQKGAYIMLVKINKVDNGGMVTDTRTETFMRALTLTNIYVKQSDKGIQLLDDNDLNKGWTVDKVSDTGRVTTYDFQPVMD